MGLSVKHLQVRDHILAYQAEHGCHPTHKVIMADCGIKSSQTVWKVIDELKRAGELAGPVFEAPKAKAAGV